MKKSDIVRKVVNDLMSEEGVEVTKISARDVQARAASAHRQSISMPLIYMVLAEMKSRTIESARQQSVAPKGPANQMHRGAIGDLDLLSAAAAFVRAAGGIENARKVLDQVEQFVTLVKEK
jgi:hypothetical protein